MFKEILFYILSLLLQKKEVEYIPWYIVDTPYLPQQIYWIDSSNILLCSYGYTEIFNTDTRASSTFETCNECIYGYDRGFVYCRYEHRDIQSMEEFSTSISLYDVKGNLVFTKDVFPTVIPLVCKRDYIFLKTAYPYLEQKEYILSVEGGKLKEIPSKKEGQNTNGGYTVVSRRDDLGKMIVIDEYMRLWVYTTEGRRRSVPRR